MKSTYFTFLDESIQEIKGEKHYILGVLTIPVTKLNKFETHIMPVWDSLKEKQKETSRFFWNKYKEEGRLELLEKKFIKKDNVEFKFNRISPEYKKIYNTLLKRVAKNEDFSFTSFVIKESDLGSYFKEVSKVLTEIFCKNIPNNSDMVVICDEISLSSKLKELFGEKLLEEIKKIETEKIKNGECKNKFSIKAILQSKSEGFLGIQVADLFAGLVGFGLKDEIEGEYRKEKQSTNYISKKEVLKTFKEFYKIEKFHNNTYEKAPFYFRIWIEI